MGNTLQFAEFLREGVARVDPANDVTTGSHNTFELTGKAHGRSPTSSFLLCSLFSDALGPHLRRRTSISPARRNGKKRSNVFVRCSRLTAFDIRPQDVLLRFLYLAAGSTLLPPFAAEGVTPPEGKTPASERDTRVRGPMEPRDAAGRAAENPHIAEGRDATPPGRSGFSVAQPSAASTTPGATPSMPIGTEGEAPATRGRRGRPHGSGRDPERPVLQEGPPRARDEFLGPGAASRHQPSARGEATIGTANLPGKEEEARGYVLH